MSRSDWRFCGYAESKHVMRFHEWQRVLARLDWATLNMTLENAAKWVCEKFIIQRIIQFEELNHLRVLLNDTDILIRWMYHFWPEGLDGLYPPGQWD